MMNIPTIEELMDAGQEFVETTSYDFPAPANSPDPDSPVMKGFVLHSSLFEPFEEVLKENPYHDSKGRFTSQEKANHHADQLTTHLAKMKDAVAFFNIDPKEYFSGAQGKLHLKNAAKSYLSYSKHAVASGSIPKSYEAWTQLYVPEFNDFLNAKLKASIGSTKAWDKIYQDNAVKYTKSDDVKKLYADSLNGDKKADKKLTQKLEFHKQNFINAGGSPDAWLAHTNSMITSMVPGVASIVTPAPLTGKTALTPSPPSVDLPAVPSMASVSGPALPAGVASMPKGSDGLPTSSWKPPPASGDASSKKEYALAQNHTLGMVYYLNRNQHGHDHDSTKAAYGEWQKSKDWLTSEGGINKSDIGTLSNKSKQAVESAESANKAAAAEAKAQAEQKLGGATNNLKMASAMYAQFLDHPIQKVKSETLEKAVALAKQVAKDAGLTDMQIETAMGDGAVTGNIALANQKNAALGNLQTAAYLSGMKKSVGGDEYKQAKKEFDAAKQDAAAFGYPKEAIATSAIQGTAKAVADAKKYKKLQDQMGDTAKHSITTYDGPAFNPLLFTDNDFMIYGDGSPKSPAMQAHIDQSKAQYASLSEKERSALASHLGGGYKAMNKGSNQTQKNTVEKALMKTVLGVDMNLRRNTGQKYVWDALGIPEADWKAETPLSATLLASLVGKSFVEKAIMSTTKRLESSISLQNEATKTGMSSLMIRAHKGIHGLDTNAGAGASSTEAEVTLAPNLTMVIRKITYTGNSSNHNAKSRYIIEVDAIGHLQSGSMVTTGKD